MNLIRELMRRVRPVVRLRRQAFGASGAEANARWLAASSLACWTGAIIAGRLLAYLGGKV